MGRCESWIELHRQHVESSFQLVLKGDALTQGWREFELPHLTQLIIVHRFVYLGDSNLILSGLDRVIHGYACGISLLIPCHHGVFLHCELLIEQDIAIDLLDDVVFNQDQPVHLDVDGEPVRVETGRDLLIYLDEDIVRRLLD